MRKKLGHPDVLEKIAKARGMQGFRDSYKDRCEVHRIACELDEKYPRMTSSDMVGSPELNHIAKYYGTPHSRKTVLRWIREVVKRPRGRPPTK